MLLPFLYITSFQVPHGLARIWRSHHCYSAADPHIARIRRLEVEGNWKQSGKVCSEVPQMLLLVSGEVPQIPQPERLHHGESSSEVFCLTAGLSWHPPPFFSILSSYFHLCVSASHDIIYHFDSFPSSWAFSLHSTFQHSAQHILMSQNITNPPPFSFPNLR